MQGLAKASARVRKFVPHTPVPSPAAVDAKEGIAAPRNAGRRLAPTLKPEGFDQLAHDARNVLSALKLYCELLAEPGVLTPGNSHYAQELEAISETASKLVERLSAPRRSESGRSPAMRGIAGGDSEMSLVGIEGSWPDDAVGDLGQTLLEMRSLLAGIAGPRVELEIAAMPCGGRSRLSKEDFTRVMLNLVRNASEAMPQGGRLRITAQYGQGLSFLEPGLIPDGCTRSVVIAVEDTGPGVPKEMEQEIFSPGFSTREDVAIWPQQPHRGLGLSIVRSLLEAAGGTAGVCPGAGNGARFELELPVTSGMYEITHTARLVADAAGSHA